MTTRIIAAAIVAIIAIAALAAQRSDAAAQEQTRPDWCDETNADYPPDSIWALTRANGWEPTIWCPPPPKPGGKWTSSVRSHQQTLNLGEGNIKLRLWCSISQRYGTWHLYARFSSYSKFAYSWSDRHQRTAFYYWDDDHDNQHSLLVEQVDFEWDLRSWVFPRNFIHQLAAHERITIRFGYGNAPGSTYDLRGLTETTAWPYITSCGS